MYVALVWGEVHAGRRIDEPIGRDPVNRKKMSAAGKGPPERARVRRSREAVTRIVGAEHFGRVLTLAEIAILTGRTHQIRVHLAAIEHPVAGDHVYNRHAAAEAADLGLQRQFLHSHVLGFNHPRDGQYVEFTSPLPPDLQEALEGLRSLVMRT